MLSDIFDYQFYNIPDDVMVAVFACCFVPAVLLLVGAIVNGSRVAALVALSLFALVYTVLFLHSPAETVIYVGGGAFFGLALALIVSRRTK